MSNYKPDIWRLQAQFDTRGLVEALENKDAAIRKRAAAALRALGAYHAIPQLEEALERETNAQTRSNILAALATLKRERKRTQKDSAVEPAQEEELSEVQRMIATLKSTQDQDELVLLAGELGKLGDKAAVEPLVVRFNDASLPIKTRLAVAEALLDLESAPVEVALLGALRSPQWRVRRNGAAILGQLKANWAVEPLAKALQDENEVVQRTAYAALRNIGTPEAHAALKTRAKDKAPSPAKNVLYNENNHQEPEDDKKVVVDNPQDIHWPKRNAPADASDKDDKAGKAKHETDTPVDETH